MDTIFAFDLDGTVTEKEILPYIAKELHLNDVLSTLTKLTLDGTLDFNTSFQLRFHILRSIPISRIHEIIINIPLNPHIENFIQKNTNRCILVTGNLDVWIEPIIKKLGCPCFSSTALSNNGELVLDTILNKGDVIRGINASTTIATIGESINDIPMFEEADIGIAFGGVHEPVPQLIQLSDYVVYEGKTLCTLLNTL